MTRSRAIIAATVVVAGLCSADAGGELEKALGSSSACKQLRGS